MACTSLEERVYRRLLRECRRTSPIAWGRLSLVTEGSGLLSEWDVALEYSRGGHLLSEGESARGRLIVEGLLQSVAGAMQWAGQQVGAGVRDAIKRGGEVAEATGKVLMQLLDKIPGGKDAFEFLKDFTSKTADKIKDYVVKAAKEFGDFVTDKKEEILGAVFGAGAEDPGVVAKLQGLIEKGTKDFGDKAEQVKAWFGKFKSSPSAAARGFFNLRKVLGAIIGDVVGMILKKGGRVAAKITGIFNSAGFTDSKTGMFFLRFLTFFSSDMSSEDTLTAAGKMWQAGKKIGSDKLDVEHRGRSLTEVIPKIVKGIVGGASALEGIIRAAAGDVGAATKLLERAIGLVRAALSNLVGKGMTEVLKSLNINPTGVIGKAVKSAVSGLVGGGESEAPA